MTNDKNKLAPVFSISASKPKKEINLYDKFHMEPNDPEWQLKWSYPTGWSAP